MAQNAYADDDAQNDDTLSRAETVGTIRDELRDAESVGETAFSSLFHAARTSSPRRYSGASIQVRVRDGKLETSDPVLTGEGEHLRGTDSYDGIISLPVKPFMETRVARQEIIRNLRDLEQKYRQ